MVDIWLIYGWYMLNSLWWWVSICFHSHGGTPIAVWFLLWNNPSIEMDDGAWSCFLWSINTKSNLGATFGAAPVHQLAKNSNSIWGYGRYIYFFLPNMDYHGIDVWFINKHISARAPPSAGSWGYFSHINGLLEGEELQESPRFHWKKETAGFKIFKKT